MLHPAAGVESTIWKRYICHEPTHHIQQVSECVSLRVCMPLRLAVSAIVAVTCVVIWHGRAWLQDVPPGRERTSVLHVPWSSNGWSPPTYTTPITGHSVVVWWRHRQRHTTRVLVYCHLSLPLSSRSLSPSPFPSHLGLSLSLISLFFILFILNNSLLSVSISSPVSVPSAHLPLSPPPFSIFLFCLSLPPRPCSSSLSTPPPLFLLCISHRLYLSSFVPPPLF